MARVHLGRFSNRQSSLAMTRLQFLILTREHREGKVTRERVRDVLEASLPTWRAGIETETPTPRLGAEWAASFCRRYGVSEPDWVAAALASTPAEPVAPTQPAE